MRACAAGAALPSLSPSTPALAQARVQGRFNTKSGTDGSGSIADNQETIFDSAHEDTINDCQYDYYGKLLASCDVNGVV